MKDYDFYLLNVFAETHFGGNPLAVFPAADGLNDEQMQLIARQFNLSETVFLQTATHSSAVKKLKIFTPDYELPFAGHPTIGASFVIRRLFCEKDQYQIETLSGLATIKHQHEEITFALKKEVKTKPCHLDNAELADILGLQETDIESEPMWINTGTWQLLIRLKSESAVKNCQISPALFMTKLDSGVWGSCYVWFAHNGQAKVRMFLHKAIR
ncbi:PhzF family phenazine biosynthesis protein [Conservatibacter flavescens]|uniref:PhzF family phenazine biosynthesis protein n=1 Tax=Conservatibacter flavescens TaxID=28161 RepID=UPI0024344005|nr:PhzF family phenazine biosynthesis protein [Conservatibacter flavescens]